MSQRIFVAGHNGMVGRAIIRGLETTKCEIVTRSRAALDLLSTADVQAFFQTEQIDYVYLAAAKVGGIHANRTYPADFLYENLMIAANVIHAAHKADVQGLLFLGSSCIYPKNAPQPMQEDALLSGPLEPTNEPYAIAKIAGIKLCESYNRQFGRDYRAIMPTNLYGSHDNYHPENAHVVPALLRRFHDAVLAGENEIVIWGSGTPKREFLHVDDMAAASLFVAGISEGAYRGATKMQRSHLNVGTGKDCTIRSLAETIAEVSGFTGALVFDRSKPDGAPQKLLDVSALNALGWTPKIGLQEGLKRSYNWFVSNQDKLRQ